MYLHRNLNLEIRGYLQQIGDLELQFENEADIDNNPFFCPNNKQIKELAHYIEKLRRQGDSVGARVKVIAKGVPVGLGRSDF